MAAADFFASLGSRADASKIAGMNNSYLFDIEGEGQWLVQVADGAITVTEGADGEADATISTTAETFAKIVSGEQNPTTAYMTGKLKIKGDMGAAMKLQKLF
jgi:putative sterol carrier protein